MPDITMCVSESCPLFKTCYRAQAVPSKYRQSMAAFRFTADAAGATKCENFWPLNEATTAIKTGEVK